MKLHLCKARKRSKEKLGAVESDGGEILVDESENEFHVDDDYDKEGSQGSNVASLGNVETAVHDDLSLGSQSEDDFKGVSPVPLVTSPDQEQLATTSSAPTQVPWPLGNRPLSILNLEDVPKELGELQRYCTSKLKELVTNNGEISAKCVASFAPTLATNCLAVASSCTPIETLLTLGSGCFGSQDSNLIVADPRGSEIQLAAPAGEEEETGGHSKLNPESLEPPTQVTGVWFVDTLNHFLDLWSVHAQQQKAKRGQRVQGGTLDSSSGSGGVLDGTNDSNSTEDDATYNLFKLLNISALLKYLGDASSADTLKVLGQQKLLALEPLEKPKAWREILANMETGTSRPQLDLDVLPELPNPHATSPCNVELKDIDEEVQLQTTDDQAFHIYWHYTDKWLKEMIGPGFKVSRGVLLGTRRWFLNLTTSTQQLFITLSKTLCCAHTS